MGVVLTPILFTIFFFLADFEVLEGLGIKFLIYADKFFIYCDNGSLETCRDKLQEAFRLILQWCTYWKLTIRPDKYHAINLSRRYAEYKLLF